MFEPDLLFNTLVVAGVALLALLPILLFGRKSDPDNREEQKRISNVLMSAIIVVIMVGICVAYFLFKVSKYW